MGLYRLIFLVFISIFLQKIIAQPTTSSNPNNKTTVVASLIKEYYNNPNHTFIGFDVNGMSAVPAVEGSVPGVGVKIKGFIVPFGKLYIASEVNYADGSTFETDYRRSYAANFTGEVGFLIKVKMIKKSITFQKKGNGNLYTWQQPVKRNFNIGIIAGYESGNRFYQAGSSVNNPVEWTLGTEKKRGIPLTLFEKYTEYQIGLGLLTTAWSKSGIILPSGSEVVRRYKAFTRFSISLCYLKNNNFDSVVNTNNEVNTNYKAVFLTPMQKYGVKLKGEFRRKLLSLNIVAGTHTGGDFKFSGLEGSKFLNRFYVGVGAGIGWM